MLTTEYLDLNKTMVLTPEEEKMIDALEGRPIAYDEDCMPLSKEYMEKILEERKSKAV